MPPIDETLTHILDKLAHTLKAINNEDAHTLQQMILDAIIVQLMDSLGVSETSMVERHANLE